MKCDKVMETIYYCTGEDVPLFQQLQLTLHLIFCPDCAREVKRFELCRGILHGDFLPPSPDLEESIMNMIACEESGIAAAPETETYAAPGGLSTRGWVIAGLVMLVSLASAFFGLDFNKLALSEGMAFLLPVGITIGIVLTSYGALFIGSHLKELSERFGL
jgi:hypothetical protein